MCRPPTGTREESAGEFDATPWSAERFAHEALGHGTELTRRALALTAQRADAEDLVQDTLLKAMASRHTFRPGTNLRAWLLQILRNAYIDRYRTARRRPAEELSPDVVRATTRTASTPPGLATPSAEDETLRNLPGETGTALRALPSHLRDVVFYADLAGFRNTEIAELLDIPVGTVGSRLHRGHQLLRLQLRPGRPAPPERR